MALRAAFALSAIEDTCRTAIWISKGPYLLAVSKAECSFTADSRPVPDGTGDPESGLALSAIEDTSQTAIWISQQPYLLAVTERMCFFTAVFTPEPDGRRTFRADFALSAIGKKLNPGLGV
jgi:hypothetical protein